MHWVVLATIDDQIHEWPFMIVGHEDSAMLEMEWPSPEVNLTFPDGTKTTTFTPLNDLTVWWRDKWKASNPTKDPLHKDRDEYFDSLALFLRHKGYKAEYPAPLGFADGACML